MEDNIIPEVKTFNKCFNIDRAKIQPIIDKALAGSRTISTEGMDKETWLSIRTLMGIGGSDAATAIGANEYTSAYQLWKEKVSGEVEILEGDYLDWGNGLEDFLRKQYAKLTGFDVREDEKMRIHPEKDCLYINLDGIVIEKSREVGTIEIKTTIRSVYKSWENKPDECPQGIPLYHYAQVQHGLSITGLEWCDLVYGITDARKVIIKRIVRDDEYIELQNKALVGWWNAYVVPNVAPPKTVAEFQYSDPIPETTKEADDNQLDLYKTILKKQANALKLKKELDELKDEMKLFIGENEGLISAGEIIATYKRISKKEFTVPAKSYRELRLKKPKQ